MCTGYFTGYSIEHHQAHHPFGPPRSRVLVAKRPSYIAPLHLAYTTPRPRRPAYTPPPHQGESSPRHLAIALPRGWRLQWRAPLVPELYGPLHTALRPTSDTNSDSCGLGSCPFLVALGETTIYRFDINCATLCNFDKNCKFPRQKPF